VQNGEKCKSTHRFTIHLSRENLEVSLRSCKIGGSKPHRAFIKLVEGSVVSKFGIQNFAQFNYEFWRKFDSNYATLKCF
jgi:hypothetical protein